MSSLTIISGVITLVLLAIVIYSLRASKKQPKAQALRERRAETPVKDTAKPPEPELPHAATAAELQDDLSQSGMVSVQEEINRCIAAGRWDEAIAWAQHAVDARPDRPEFKVKLAEIYHRAGEREAFMALFDELKGKLGDNHELRRQLIAMARKTMPGQESSTPEPDEKNS